MNETNFKIITKAITGKEMEIPSYDMSELCASLNAAMIAKIKAGEYLHHDGTVDIDEDGCECPSVPSIDVTLNIPAKEYGIETILGDDWLGVALAIRLEEYLEWTYNDEISFDVYVRKSKKTDEIIVIEISADIEDEEENE